VQPLLRDLMVPTDNGCQSVLLLKSWVRKLETCCATPPIGKHGRPDSEGLRYLSFLRGHPAAARGDKETAFRVRRETPRFHTPSDLHNAADG
jgi:hypothetical protein